MVIRIVRRKSIVVARKRLALTNTDLSVFGDVGLEESELKIMGLVVSFQQKE